MWHGTFILAVGFFPFKSCTLRHADFGRVLSAKLLLLLVIFVHAVTVHYLINMLTRTQDIFFRIGIVAFFSFYVTPTLYPSIG